MAGILFHRSQLPWLRIVQQYSSSMVSTHLNLISTPSDVPFKISNSKTVHLFRASLLWDSTFREMPQFYFLKLVRNMTMWTFKCKMRKFTMYKTFNQISGESYQMCPCIAIRIFISQLFDIVSKSVTWDEWDLFLVTNTWDGSCFWSRLSNLIQVRILPAFLKCEIVRGWERGNQRTFSSAFGEFQTTGPPTVLQLTMQGIQPSVLCTTQHSRGRCSENILQMDFQTMPVGEIMLF